MLSLILWSLGGLVFCIALVYALNGIIIYQDYRARVRAHNRISSDALKTYNLNCDRADWVERVAQELHEYHDYFEYLIMGDRRGVVRMVYREGRISVVVASWPNGETDKETVHINKAYQSAVVALNRAVTWAVPA